MNDAPAVRVDALLAGKVRAYTRPGTLSGIDKQPLAGEVHIGELGLLEGGGDVEPLALGVVELPFAGALLAPRAAGVEPQHRDAGQDQQRGKAIPTEEPDHPFRPLRRPFPRTSLCR